MTPEADPLVERWRAEHDWAAAHGVAAHVTVRMPFLDPDEWDSVAGTELGVAAGDVDSRWAAESTWRTGHSR